MVGATRQYCERDLDDKLLQPLVYLAVLCRNISGNRRSEMELGPSHSEHAHNDEPELVGCDWDTTGGVYTDDLHGHTLSNEMLEAARTWETKGSNQEL